MTQGVEPTDELFAVKNGQHDERDVAPPIGSQPSLGRGLGWSALMLVMVSVSAFVYLIGYSVYLTLVQSHSATLLDVDTIETLTLAHSESVDALFGLLGLETLFVLPLLLFAAHFKGQSWRKTLAVQTFSRYSFWLASWLFLAYLAVSVSVDILWVSEPDDFIAKMLGTKSLWASIALVVFAPLVEEFFFRGYLFAMLRPTRLGAWGTLVITSLLFTLAHAGQYQWSVLCVVGLLALFLGYVREKSGSIWLPILFHALNNLLAVVFVIWLGVS
ncbi:MAG: CPBP family intramembrane metalloprotease [Reinekea forsetii]|nr:CPBP family intramembrane metalloprotease [Reinekea forsetii]MDO7645387.1 CPBP family intramembrane metalloprotease [Reinekea forsetii]